jgi:hypothetical protein
VVSIRAWATVVKQADATRLRTWLTSRPALGHDGSRPGQAEDDRAEQDEGLECHCGKKKQGEGQGPEVDTGRRVARKGGRRGEWRKGERESESDGEKREKKERTGPVGLESSCASDRAPLQTPR